jgi:hypothetical protein
MRIDGFTSGGVGLGPALGPERRIGSGTIASVFGCDVATALSTLVGVAQIFRIVIVYEIRLYMRSEGPADNSIRNDQRTIPTARLFFAPHIGVRDDLMDVG